MSQASKYLGMIKIELEECLEDIDLLQRLNEEREKRHELTNYAKLENQALLTTEFHGIQHLIEELDKINPALYDDLNIFKEELDKKFLEIIKKSDSPMAVYYIVKRKLGKIQNYIQQE
jgi:hypothetical protein